MGTKPTDDSLEQRVKALELKIAEQKMVNQPPEQPPEGDDGVVKYTSAHLDQVDSEFIIRSGPVVWKIRWLLRKSDGFSWSISMLPIDNDILLTWF